MGDQNHEDNEHFANHTILWQNITEKQLWSCLKTHNFFDKTSFVGSSLLDFFQTHSSARHLFQTSSSGNRIDYARVADALLQKNCIISVNSNLVSFEENEDYKVSSYWKNKKWSSSHKVRKRQALGPFGALQYNSNTLTQHHVSHKEYRQLLRSASEEDCHKSSSSLDNPDFAPFVRVDPNPASYEMLKLIFGTFTLVPLRLLALKILLLVFIVFTALLKLYFKCTTGNWCIDRGPIFPTTFFARLTLYILGFYKIQVVKKDGDTPKPKAALIFVCNHLSILDYLVLLATVPQVRYFFIKHDFIMFRIPILGRILSWAFACHVLDVADIGTCDGKVSDYLYLLSNDRQLVIFPEGTTTNGTHLLHFHSAAFEPGIACQPIVLRYPFKYFSLCYESIYTDVFVLRLLTQFVNTAVVELLPLINPSTGEKKDPSLYADNVRCRMARALGVKTSESGFREKILYHDVLRRMQIGNKFRTLHTHIHHTSPSAYAINNCNVRSIQDVSYCKTANCRIGHKHQLDIYLSNSHNNRRPLVFWIHGGGWQRGDRRAWMYFMSCMDVNWLIYLLQKYVFACYVNTGMSLASAGYTVMIPSYRLSTLEFPYFLFEVVTSFFSSLSVLYPLMIILCHAFFPNRWERFLFVSEEDTEKSSFKIMVDTVFLCAGLLGLVWSNIRGSSLNLYSSVASRLKPWATSAAFSLLFILIFPTSLTIIAAVLAFTIALFGAVIHTICKNSQSVKHPTHVQDVAAALEWAVSRDTIAALGESAYDPSQIVLIGHSAGAHLASLLALDSTYLSSKTKASIVGVVGICGVYDLRRLQRQSVLTSKLYVAPAFNQDDIDSASPINHVLPSSLRNKIPPFCLINAERDAGLEVDAEAFRKALPTHAAPESVVIIPNTNHLTIITSIQDHLPFAKRHDVTTHITEFIEKNSL